MPAHAKVLSFQDTDHHRLTPLLAPRSIALVGASRKRNTVGNDMMRNIITSGYAGSVYPVNPGYATLYGFPCYAGFKQLPEAVDLAILSVPNRVLEAVVDEAIAAGARALVIFASAELEGESESDFPCASVSHARPAMPGCRYVVRIAWVFSTLPIRFGPFRPFTPSR